MVLNIEQETRDNNHNENFSTNCSNWNRKLMEELESRWKSAEDRIRALKVASKKFSRTLYYCETKRYETTRYWLIDNRMGSPIYIILSEII